MAENSEKKKKDLFLLHVVVTFLLMFSIGNLPTFEAVTPVGMKMLGIFVGVVYAWSTTSLIWPSMLGILATATTGIIPMNELFPLCFADQTVWFMTLIFVFIAVMEEAGVINYMANWMLSRKIIFGRPWLFTFFFLFAAWGIAALTNETPTCFLFWSLFYSIAAKVGLKPSDKYSFLMVFGIGFLTMAVANNVLPYKLGPLFYLGTYESITGMSVDFGKLVLFTIPLAILEVILFVLMMRFIFRVDVSAIKAIDDTFINKSALQMNLKLKIAFIYMVAMIVLLLIPDFCPDSWAIVQFLQNIGKPGTMVGILLSMFIVRVDKKPMIDFAQAARGISWDVFFMLAFILPFANLLISDKTGLRESVVSMLTPMLQGTNSMLFILIVLLSGTLLTNVLNNGVLSILFMSLTVSLAEIVQIDPFPTIVVMMFTISLAFLTPGGSGAAAIIFANKKWVRPADMYKNVPIVLLFSFILYFVVGLPLAYLVF